MIKLKPCPFCGGEAVVDKYPVRGYEPAVSFEVRCSSCNQTRAGGYFDTVYKSERWARKKAIEAWNKRVKTEGKTSSTWHVGTPTEEGWYLTKVKIDGEIIYDTNYLTPCMYGMDWRYAHEEILEWQKMEEN